MGGGQGSVLPTDAINHKTKSKEVKDLGLWGERERGPNDEVSAWGLLAGGRDKDGIGHTLCHLHNPHCAERMGDGFT